MQLAAVRVGLGLAAAASGALVGFMVVGDHPDPPKPIPTPAPAPTPPAPPPVREIPTRAPTPLAACARGVYVTERDVELRTDRGWFVVTAEGLSKAKKPPHLAPFDGDVDPAYAVVHDLQVELRDRDGEPLERLRFTRPREPAVSGLGPIVTAHDVDDPDETPCAIAPIATTLWRTDPMVVEVRFSVAAGCPEVCALFAAPRPNGLGDQ